MRVLHDQLVTVGLVWLPDFSYIWTCVIARVDNLQLVVHRVGIVQCRGVAVDVGYPFPISSCLLPPAVSSEQHPANQHTIILMQRQAFKKVTKFVGWAESQLGS